MLIFTLTTELYSVTPAYDTVTNGIGAGMYSYGGADRTDRHRDLCSIDCFQLLLCLLLKAAGFLIIITIADNDITVIGCIVIFFKTIKQQFNNTG